MKLQITVNYLIAVAILTTIQPTHSMHHVPQILTKNLSVLRIAQTNSLKKLPFSTQSKTTTDTQKALVTLGATSLGIAGGLYIATQLDSTFTQNNDSNEITFLRLKDGKTLKISEIAWYEAEKRDIAVFQDFFHFNPWRKESTTKTARAQLMTDSGPLTVGIALYRKLSQKEYHLDYLVVAPDYQGNGIGRALIENIIQNTKCEKIKIYSLETPIPFYKKIGCRQDPKYVDVFYFINEKLEEEKRITHLTRYSAFQ